MVEFLKAFDERHSTVFEMSTVARNERRAKVKATVALVGMRPSEVTAISNIEVTELGDGLLKEYRVNIFVEDEEDIRSKLKIPEALKALEEKI